MLELAPPALGGHELVDSGGGRRLERFGGLLLDRPDAACLWARADPAAWRAADLVFVGEGRAAAWRAARSRPESWTATVEGPAGPLTLELRATVSKNVGLFPEQAAQWAWMAGKLGCAGVPPLPPEVLNLFAYTGGATLALASAGAAVCHVDAARTTVAWARRNAELSGLAGRPVRWIVEDAERFLEREAKRGRRYDALLLDPPAFGRDPKGRPFKFLEAIPALLAACRAVLVERPRFVVLNGYATGLSAVTLGNLLADAFPGERIEHGELHLAERARGRHLPCSTFARFSARPPG